MSQEEESIHSFIKLGLTYLQAKVYITLLKMGTTGVDVRKIARASAIARQDIYRILPSLEKMGLAQKIIAMPAMYKPITLEDGISLLLKKRTDEYHDMQKKAKSVLETFVMQQPQHQENISQFVITSERSLFMKRVREHIAQSRRSIDIVYHEERLRAIVFYTIDDFEKAIARGVKVRAMTTTEQGKSPDENLKKLTNNPSFKLRYINKDIPVGLVIFDGVAVKFRTSENIVPSLWTNNRNVVKLSQIYFDSMWL